MLSQTQSLGGSRPEYYWRVSREDMYVAAVVGPMMFSELGRLMSVVFNDGRGGNRFCSKIVRHDWRDGI
jgi:hypothetical protein